MTGYIKIELKSDLCVGSGEAYGQVIDNDICTDFHGLPIIPARRIKGVLREQAQMLRDINYISADVFNRLFGETGTDGGCLRIKNAMLFKGNADLSRLDKYSPEEVTTVFSAVRAQTALTDVGCADENTLRYTRVCLHHNPINNSEMCFYAEVSIDDDNDSIEALEAVCMAVRHMGMNRSRGLGAVKCRFEHEQKTDSRTDICQR